MSLARGAGKDGALGAILGAALGFALARIPGALVGALLGHLLQRQLSAPSRVASPRTAVERARALVGLAVSIAEADGPLETQERDAIRSYFQRDAGLSAQHLPVFDRLIDSAIDAGSIPPKEAACALPALDPADRVHVLFVLFRVALADRVLAPAELVALREVAETLGLSRADFSAVRAHFVTDGEDGGGGEGDDYRTLGVDPRADLDTVKARYRDAVKSYHPDRFQHLGDEFISVAEEKFKSIQEAYERIVDGTTRVTPRLDVCEHCRTFSPPHVLSCPRCRQTKHRLENGSVRVRCPFCRQTNGFPSSALGGQVRCGNCKVLLVR